MSPRPPEVKFCITGIRQHKYVDWTGSEGLLAWCRARVDEDWSMKRIGDAIGVSRNTVIGALQRAGINKFAKRAAQNKFGREWWTPERDTTLLDLYKRGLTIKVIGQTMKTGQEAVRARVKLLARRGALQERRQGGKTVHVIGSRQEPRLPVRPAKDMTHIDGKRMRLVEMTGRHCKFPLWGNERDAEKLYCGERTIPGESWCPRCHALVYRPVEVRRVAA